MKVLVACEYSGIVRNEFQKLGHDAWSCDLLPTEIPGKHYQGYLEDFINIESAWDLIIAHPPCDHLAVSGARWFEEKRKDGRQEKAIAFFMMIANIDCPKICIENPVGIMSSLWRKPDQIIQPYQFGHEATKTTCLWLKNLPLLKPTNIVSKGERHVTKSGRSLPKWYNLPPSDTRWKDRSRTFFGIAQAMADQWGK